MARQRIKLAPLGGIKSQRVSDNVLDGIYMRGGYNVEVRNGEWWTRKGESNLFARIASTSWWWCVQIHQQTAIVANPFWALTLDSGGLNAAYTPAATQNVTFTNGSATATPTTTRTVNQLILVGSGVGPTSDVYRVVAATGAPSITLDRPFEGTTGAKNCRFLDPLSRNVAGTAATYTIGDQPVTGSAVMFEQLVTHAATAVHAASPATTAGHTYLVITSILGVPVAIDVTAILNGTPADLARLFFYNTALATPAQVGTDTATYDTIPARGSYAAVYGDRLFIAYATDPNGNYGDRTIWWSQIGDLTQWHTGIQGVTATPNFKTFSGEEDGITAIGTLNEQIVTHRKHSQEVGTITASLAQPFTFRSIRHGIGAPYGTQILAVGGRQFLWSTRGPATFDGQQMQPIAPDAMRDLQAYDAIDHRYPVRVALHDIRRGLFLWVLMSSRRHQDALPATATKTSLSGLQYQNYGTVFVYDYLNDQSWFEDHPAICGGGTTPMSPSGAADIFPEVIISRFDGTLLKLCGRTHGKDADIDDPADANKAVTVNCQAETQFLDFGNPLRKTVIVCEVTMRAIDVGGSSYDTVTDIADGNYWLRLRTYGDMQELTAMTDAGVVYDNDALQLDSLADNRQSPTGLMRFTIRHLCREIKLVFTNALSAAASSAGYKQAPFRISCIAIDYSQGEGTDALTTLNNGQINA